MAGCSVDVEVEVGLVAATGVDLRPKRDLVVDPVLLDDPATLDQELGDPEQFGADAGEWSEVRHADVVTDQLPQDGDAQSGVALVVVGLQVANLESRRREWREQLQQ